MIYILGGNGFVGSAYTRLFQSLKLPYQVVTRDNMSSFAGMPCDILINANGNSKKYLADRDPLADFNLSVQSVAETLELFHPRLYIFLSSGDVYPDQTSPSTTREESDIDPSRLSRYGLHKLLSEKLVQGGCDRWLIFRMGGFIGRGLKKNAIFDMLKGRSVWLDPDSALQFISTDHAAQIIWRIAEAGIYNTIINTGAKGTIRLRDVHSEISSTSNFAPGSPKITYELSLGRFHRFGKGALPNTADEVREFIASVRLGDIELASDS